MNQLFEKNKNLVKFGLILVYLSIFLIPGFVFFRERGGVEYLQASSSKIFVSRIFPLLGLYAFFFVWVQIIIGSSMSLLNKVFPKLLNFHRTQGIFALLLAITHPILVFFVYQSAYIGFKFLPYSLQIYGYFGLTAVSLMVLTVLSALVRKHPLLRKHWRKVHIFNYLIFILIWLHSWNLGSDVQSTNLRYLWYFYGLTAAVALAVRVYRQTTKPKIVPSKPSHING